jgi:hypothetical protein
MELVGMGCARAVGVVPQMKTISASAAGARRPAARERREIPSHILPLGARILREKHAPDRIRLSTTG